MGVRIRPRLRSLPNGVRDELNIMIVSAMVSIPSSWFSKLMTNSPVGFDMYRASGLFTTRNLNPRGILASTQTSLLTRTNGNGFSFMGGSWTNMTNINQYAHWVSEVSGYGIDMLVPTGQTFVNTYGVELSFIYQLATPKNILSDRIY